MSKLTGNTGFDHYAPSSSCPSLSSAPVAMLSGLGLKDLAELASVITDQPVVSTQEKQ